MPQRLRIFISSPGDVTEEREKAKKVIAALEQHYGGQVQMVPVLWEDLPIAATTSFQEGIDLVLSDHHRIDIAVFILWSRFGSALGDAIKKRDGSPYQSGTEREFDLLLTAYEQSGRKFPLILAYTRDDEKGFRDKLYTRTEKESGLDELLRQRKLVDQFIREQFQDAQGRNLRAYHTYREPLSFAQRLHVHLSHVVSERLGHDQPGAVWSGTPYRSLAAFDIEHARIFCGRDEETCDLLDRLHDQALGGCAFVCIVGASGSGKSSLARAGVAATLMHRSFDDRVKAWRAATFIPGHARGNLLGALARCLAEPPPLSDDLHAKLEAPLPTLRDATGGLESLTKAFESQDFGTALRLLDAAFRAEAGKLGGTLRVVLVLDQMEELWTDRDHITPDQRTAFLNVIEALARGGQISVLATLRSDFYSQAQGAEAFLRMKGARGHFDLTPPGTSALRELIVQPALSAGLAFESDKRTGRILDARILEDASGHGAALPLLQYALGELYENRDQAQNLLTFAAYEAMGGVEGALGKRAEETFANLPEEARKVLPELLKLLVTVDLAADTDAARRRAPMSGLTATPQRELLTKALVAARFLTTDKRDEDGVAVASFTHEALLRRWSRLAEWVTENKASLRACSGINTSARLWREHASDKSYSLLTGVQLADAKRLLAEDFIQAQDRDFVEASIAAAAEEEFRWCIATGGDMLEQSHRLETEHPEMRLRVISELLKTGTLEERRNSALLLGQLGPMELSRELVPVVVGDREAAVRRAAAWSLMRLDDTKYCDQVAALHDERDEVKASTLGLAHLLVAADMQTEAPKFDKWYQRLPSELRVRVRLMSWLQRWKMAVPVFFAVVIPAIIFSMGISMVMKLVPGWFNFAYGQARANTIASAFHGGVAAMVIGGVSAFGLTFYRMVLGREHGRFHYLRPFGAVIAGAIGGFVGGLLTDVAIAGVFDPTALQLMGWLDDGMDKPDGAAFISLLFRENMCGWVFALNGMGTGIGMALLTNRLRGAPEWDQFLSERSSQSVGAGTQIGSIVKGLIGLARRYSWPLPLCLFVTSVLGLLILPHDEIRMPKYPGDSVEILRGGLKQLDVAQNSSPAERRELELAEHKRLRNWKTSLPGRVIGITCDSACKVVGGFFAVVGMGIGIVILRGGISVEPRRRLG